METLEELQSLWQSQAAAPGISVEELVSDLRAHSRKHLGIYAVKTAAVVLLLVPMLIFLRHSPVIIAGLLLVATGAAITLFLDWRMHLALARLEFTTSTAGFVPEAIRRLRSLKRPMKIQLLALLCGPLAGLNLMAWVLLAIAAVLLGFRVRRRRFEREMTPLLDRLQAFQAQE